MCGTCGYTAAGHSDTYHIHSRNKHALCCAQQSSCTFIHTATSASESVSAACCACSLLHVPAKHTRNRQPFSP
jgi:hypothetical protein